MQLDAYQISVCPPMSLRHVILTLLAEQPASGYDITKRFDASLGYFWQASHQQVYRELARLTEAGLVSFETVTQGERPAKKVYRLTPQGREALLAWLERPASLPVIKDELLVKMWAVAGLAAGDPVPDVVRRRAEHAARLVEYRDLERDCFAAGCLAGLPEADRLRYLTLRRGILAEQAWLDWCDEALSCLPAAPPG